MTEEILKKAISDLAQIVADLSHSVGKDFQDHEDRLLELENKLKKDHKDYEPETQGIPVGSSGHESQIRPFDELKKLVTEGRKLIPDAIDYNERTGLPCEDFDPDKPKEGPGL